MSILIKGMKKPDCYSCPFARDGWPDEWEMHCVFLDRQVGYFGKKLKKPKDCPIVEVPTPHGRLIDADELDHFMYHHAFELDSANQRWDSGCWIRYRLFENAMKSIPTIIEAEEGAEE